jgi:hypothetical protein
MTTTTDPLTDRATQGESAADVIAHSTPNSKYASEWKKYKKWITQSTAVATPVDGQKWLTKNNLDVYFEQQVRLRLGNKNSTRTVMNALQWFADYQEHVGSDPKFIVGSPRIELALKAQERRREAAGGYGNPGTDPKRGLKDIFPNEDKVRVMKHIYSNRHDWASAAPNFTWGHNGAVRGHSNRKCGISDMNMSYGFGPANGDRCLLLVLRKGLKNKDRHTMDKQVGVWRNRDYLQCSVFASAASVIHRLATESSRFKFLQPDKRVRPSWWDIPLIDWEELSGKKSRMLSKPLLHLLFLSHNI